jgi:hypothetical protein
VIWDLASTPSFESRALAASRYPVSNNSIAGDLDNVPAATLRDGSKLASFVLDSWLSAGFTVLE